MTRAVSEEEFLKSVADHQLEIMMDRHVYRHLRFRKPGTSCMSFDIVTYPGYLCYSGDMGSFVFTRIHDMICFFRGKPEGPIEINPRYWSEKLEAVSRSDGSYEEYDAAKFRAFIDEELTQFREYIERDTDRDPDDDDEEAHKQKIDAAFEELKRAVIEEIRSKADDGEYAVYSAMRDFEHDKRHWFQDCWEVSFREYTYRFIWCCFALVWGIRQYDAAKAKTAKAADDAAQAAS